jgi:hypothetical protein
MATLILEHERRRKAAVLKGRIVIGRRSNSHIVVPDRTVSRIHAWIGQNGSDFFIVDSGSRVGTLVNGAHLKGRHTLCDGDQIRVGSAVITFHSNGTLPEDAEEIDLESRSTSGNDGIFLDCSCGAPLWAPWDFAGRLGQCRYCGQMVELPPRAGSHAPSDPSADTIYPGAPVHAAGASSAAPVYRGISISPGHRPTRVIKPSIFDAPAPAEPPIEPHIEPRLDDDKEVLKAVGSAVEPPAPPRFNAPAAAEPNVLCGACQSEINEGEETTNCPDCGVSFHADCWMENRGCSSYGCKQVGALEPKPADVDGLTSLELEPDSGEAASTTAGPRMEPSVEWDYLILPVALVSSLVGLLTFGIPALLAGAGAYVYRKRARSMSHPQMVLAAIAISCAAAVAGFAISWYWWLVVPAAPGI